jgi:hypothetical protein
MSKVVNKFFAMGISFWAYNNKSNKVKFEKINN